jgi:ABC-type Na+ efflux pump permease subunit
MVQESTGRGIGVDAFGGSVIDPTKNVLDLTAAANKRQDDLWDIRALYIGAEIRRLEEIVRRVEETSKLRSDFSAQMTDVHQHHDTSIHRMEQEKIAALRSIDEMVRITEANRNLQAVNELARQTTNIREALASQMADSMAEVNKRLSAVELQQSEGRGKQTVADPMMVQLVEEVKALRGTSAQGSKNLIGYVSIGLSILIGLLVLADKIR